MSFPNYPNKFQEKSIFTGKDYWRYKKGIGEYPELEFPNKFILCYHPLLINHIINNYNVKKIQGFFGDLYFIQDFEEKIGIYGNFGIGSPIVAIIMEELSVLGVKNFLSIGLAGSLQKDVGIVSFVLCNKAIRDEGTSHHYIKSEKYSYPSPKINQTIQIIMKSLELQFHVGTSWTTDAPYRETIAEVKKYQEEGVLTVEMESAAIFAVGKYLNLEVGAIFTISDTLFEDKWEQFFHLTDKHLEILFLIARDTLLQFK